MANIDGVASDIRHIVRALARRPAFSAAAILTMALGLGAVTAIVAVADMVLLRPLPYPRADRLYSLSATLPAASGRPAPFVLSRMEFVRVRELARSLEQVEAMSPTEMALSTGGEPNTVRVATASAGYLHLFGLDPVIGRNFTEAEDRARVPVVVLDGGLWQRRFGSDPSIVGRSVLLDGSPYVVIGVTPAGYRPQLQAIDAWTPLGAVIDPALTGRNLVGAARLREGVSAPEAYEELRAIEAGVRRDFAQSHATAELVFREMHEALYGPFKPALRLLLAGVAVLLLIACTNVANLALGRVAERRGEISLRLSLGAGTRRILRYQLTESAIIAAAGCLAGATLAFWALPAFVAIYPAALPADIDGALQPRVIAIVSALMVVSTVLAGLAPAWRASRVPAGGVLAQTTLRTVGHVRDRRTREWLLAGQLACAVILLSTAAVVSAGFAQLNRTDPGFDYQSVLTLQLAPPARYPQPQARAQFVARVLERIEEIPGVVAAGTTQTTWQLLASMQSRIEIEGRLVDPQENIFVNIRHVTPGYFTALRVRVNDGRAIDERDAFGRDPVAMVSQAFADRFWPGQRAVGRRFKRATAGAPWLTVVGVAGDVMDSGLGSNIGATMYVPYVQQNTPTVRVTLVVRTEGEPTALATAIQKAVWSVDAQQPIDAVRTLEAALGESTAQPRFRALVLTAFGVAGLVLACVGVYGVAAYAASVRRREIGVRVALGARGGEVVRLLVRQSLRPVLIGIGAGVIGAAGSARWINAFLQQTAPPDPVTLGASAGLLFVCALVATWLPARRSARVAPIDAIRQD